MRTVVLVWPDLCFDFRLMMILHGDGSINAISLREKASLKGLKVCLRDNDSFHPTFLQRPEERTLSEEDSSDTITTRLYFLSTTLLSAVSRGGATALFVIDSNKLANSVSKTSPICSISGGFPRAVVESLPPKMGPCACTAYAGSDTSQFLLLLRMNDAWSCQIFRMIVTPPEKAIHAMLNSKCCRKTLDRALALAEKSKLRADLVYKEAAMEILNTISLDSVSHTYQNHSENEIPYGLKDLPFILENIDDDLFVVQFLAIVPGCLRFLGIDFDLLMELTILDDLLREALRRADAISHPTQDYRQSAKVLECVAKCRSILMQKLEVLSALTLVLHQSACESESVWYFSANRAHNTNDWISGGEWSLLEGSSSTLIDGAELLDLQNTDPMNLNTTRIRDRQSKSSVKDLEKRLLMFLLDNVQLFKSSDKNLASTALSQDIFSISLDDIVQFCARAGLINLLDCLVERWPRFKLNLLELVDSIPLFISPKVYLPLIYKTLQLLEDNTLDNAVGSQEVYNDGSLVPEEEDFYFTRQTANRLAENSVVIQELVKHTVLSCIAASASKHSPTDMLSCWDKVQFLKYIARHAMKLEFYGQSMFAYHVAEFAIVNYRKCSGEGKDADEIAEALRQWSLEIRVFCNFLYSDTIPKANSFTDWLAMSTLKKLEVVVEYSLATQQNLAYVINHLIRPAMDTLDRTTTTSWLPTLIKLISGSTYASRLQLVLHKLHRLDLTMKDTLDESLTSILVQLLKPMEYQCLSAVLLVVQASVPTLPLNERCIQSTSSLMRLVVNSSFAYDDIDSGMALMWQMIECTPSRQATIDNSAPESALATTKQLLVRLDALEAALTAAELIKLYIAVPPLSILIETEAFQASTNLSNVEHSIHKWRLTKRQYTQQLLRGIAFLANQLLPSQLIKNTADGSDRSTDETDILDSSAEFTPDHLSLGEALFLRIIHDFYLLWSRVSNNSTIAREKSGVLSAGWSGLANNLIDLRNNYFNRISLVWIGRALLQCLIHYNVDNIYVPAALCLVGKKADSEEKLYQNLENDVASLGFTLSTMGVTAQCAWATLLEKSKEFFNAVSSRDEADYAQALRLLEIVQSNFSNDSVDSTQFQKLRVDTEAESRLHQLLKFLSSIEMDFIPVQLRLLQPLTVMQKILEERPEAYYCILGTNDEMDSSSTPSFERNTDNFFIRRRQILDNLFPSSLSRFLDTLFGLSSNKSSDESEALLLLMQVGLKLGDLVGCFKLCKLAMKPEWYGSASTSTQQEISSMVSVLIGLLSGDDGFDLSEKLIHTFLMNDLQASLMVCTGEMGSKGSFQSPTWQQEESTDFNLMKSSENVASQGLELLYMAINSTLSIEESDPENLIRAIAVKVIMEEALGYFLLSVDTDFSLQGVEKLVSDLERKYTQLKVRIIRQDSTGNSPLPSVGIDESLIQALIKKGFTRNGAKRSVYMVSRQSAESPRTRAGTSTLLSQSIAYAIDHCGDPDFDHPVVEAVSGALRGKVANKLSNSEDVDLEIQYRKVHELLVLFRELKFCLQTALGLPHIATQPLTVEDPVLSDGSIPSTPNLIGLPSNLPSTQNNSSPSTTIETSRSIRKPREKTVREKPKATKKTLGARKITDEIDERNTTDSSLVGQITERMVDIANESAFAPGLLEGKEYTTEPLPQIAVEGFAETLDSLQQSMDLPEIPKLAIISSNVIGKVEVELSTDKTRANADRIGKQPETKLDETFGELVDLSNQKSVADIDVQKPIVEFDNSSRSDQPFVEADREIAVDILEDLIAGEVSEEISEPHELYLRQLTGLLEVGASYVGFDAENIESIVVAFGHENREMELQRNQSRRFEVSADLCSNSGSSTVYNLLCALAICREESAEELLLQLLRIIVNSFLPFAQSFEKSLIKELHRNHPGKLDVRRVVSEQASALEVLNFWTCILRLQNRLFFTGDTVIPTINTSEKNLRVDLNSTAIADRLISDLISIDPRG